MWWFHGLESDRMISLFSQVAHTVTDTNIVLSTSFLVASTIHLFQTPTLCEIDFINRSTALQSCVVAESLLGSLTLGHTTRRKRLWYVVCCLSIVPEAFINHLYPPLLRMKRLARVADRACGLENELRSWNVMPLWVGVLLAFSGLLGILWLVFKYFPNVAEWLLSRKIDYFCCMRWQGTKPFQWMREKTANVRWIRAASTVIGLVLTSIGWGEWGTL
jgi:hypothetical protein